MKAIERISLIEPKHFGGLRHKRAPYGSSNSYQYGWRVAYDWFQKGAAQAALLEETEKPRASMLGVSEQISTRLRRKVSSHYE